MEAKKMYFMDCHLAGRMYHDADEVWDELKVGTILRLERDKDNHHDPNAVAVIYEQKNKKGEMVDHATVYVTKEQQSIAIGRVGQNVRLASKLTGYDIDVEVAKAPEKKKRKDVEDSLLSALDEVSDDSTEE